MSYTLETARHLVGHGGSCRDIYCEKVIDKDTVEKCVCFTYCYSHDGGTEYACYKKAREYLKEKVK